jgi:hypothetical protein
MSNDFLDADLFAPMTAEEVSNFNTDIVMGALDGISPETVEVVAKLMKKHGAAAYARLDGRRNARRADKVSLSEAVKDVSKDFEHLFTK